MYLLGASCIFSCGASPFFGALNCVTGPLMECECNLMQQQQPQHGGGQSGASECMDVFRTWWWCLVKGEVREIIDEE